MIFVSRKGARCEYSNLQWVVNVFFFERTTEDTEDAEVEKKEVFTSDLRSLYSRLYFTLIFYSNIEFFSMGKATLVKILIGLMFLSSSICC